MAAEASNTVRLSCHQTYRVVDLNYEDTWVICHLSRSMGAITADTKFQLTYSILEIEFAL